MAASTPGLDLAAARALQPELAGLRRRIHAQPEVGLDLPLTQATVLEALDGLGLEIHTGTELSSVTAVLRGTAEAREDRVAVVLRGDMDALPIDELSGEDFASTNGAMHACGHDLHVAGLLGAARLLAGVREHLPGDVVFMFQPGEEGYDGAGTMIEEGVLDAAGVPVVAAYGVHVSADQPLGEVFSKPGSLMAAFSMLDVVIEGSGGHAARPHAALDPIQVAASVIGQLQDYVTRRFDVFDPVVFTVGQFHAGTAANVIPDTARFSAGMRTFSDEVTARVTRELPELVDGIVRAHGLRARVDCRTLLPATINDDAEAEFYLETFGGLYGEAAVHRMENPRAGSEDFSRVLQRVPGAYGHFGAAPPGGDPYARPANHSPRATHDDSLLHRHALFLATLAARRLRRNAPGAQGS